MRARCTCAPRPAPTPHRIAHVHHPGMPPSLERGPVHAWQQGYGHSCVRPTAMHASESLVVQTWCGQEQTRASWWGSAMGPSARGDASAGMAPRGYPEHRCPVRTATLTATPWARKAAAHRMAASHYNSLLGDLFLPPLPLRFLELALFSCSIIIAYSGGTSYTSQRRAFSSPRIAPTPAALHTSSAHPHENCSASRQGMSHPSSMSKDFERFGALSKAKACPSTEEPRAIATKRFFFSAANLMAVARLAPVLPPE
mmetsp:Transcript_54295/g.107836  ORF Transcript_54295/g.107836 Transcript_54295/m.107836 type:complete len:256 (-) Transcript_54295:1221-1988(-)